MASAASLVVRISADMNDFDKKLKTMTRGVDTAAKKVESVGRSMMIGITLPVAAATVALSKMAAQNEDTAGRVSRVFGIMAGSVEGSIKQMMKTVPETQTDLENMAVSIDNMLQGMDLAPRAAASMSEQLLKLAADASAFAHVPMSQALDALGKGLAGKTKGLLEFGIAVKEADVKQRAYQMGLVGAGQELTETGTALAAYNLIMEKSSRITGEAARTADQSGKQFAFLKRDLGELADNLSSFVLPGTSALAKGARDVTADMAGASDGAKKFSLATTGLAAAIVPTLFLVTKMARADVMLQASLVTIAEAGGTAGAAGTIAGLATPIGQAVLAIGALTAAVAGYMALYEHFNPSAQSLLAPLGGLNGDPALAAFIKNHPATLPKEKNGATNLDPRKDFELLKDNASIFADAFDRAVDHGGDIVKVYERIAALQRESIALQEKYPMFSKERAAVDEAADRMQRYTDAVKLMSASPGQGSAVLASIGGRPYDAGAAGALSAVDAANSYRRDLATRAAASQYGTPYNAGIEAVIASRGKVTSSANDLALRESLLKLPDGFDAARQASVEFAETQRQTLQDQSLEWEKTKLAMTTFAGLSLQAGQLLGGLAAKVGGGGLLGGLGGSVGGGLFSSLLSKGSKFLPLVGGIGSVVGAFVGKGLDSLFGGSHKKAVDDSASSLNNLATTAQKVSEALSNIPSGFKIAYDRFLAAAPVTPSAPGQPSVPGTPGAPGSPGDGDPIHEAGVRIAGNTFHFHGVTDMAEFTRQFGEFLEFNSTRGGATALRLSVTG